ACTADLLSRRTVRGPGSPARLRPPAEDVMATFSSIGKSVPRLDGSCLVSGAGRYTADYHPAGTLWARLLRSAEPHARLVRVDATRARALPGVHAVLTGADTGGLHIGSQRRDWPLLALDRVRFVGDPIA